MQKRFDSCGGAEAKPCYKETGVLEITVRVAEGFGSCEDKQFDGVQFTHDSSPLI